MRFLGWLFFALGCLAGLGLGLLLHLHESEAVPEVSKWESNWPQLKQGMTKEQVLNLVGAPSSTNVVDAQITSMSSTPSNPKLDQFVRQQFDQMNYAIWSYYGAISIHTTPGEDVQTAMGQAFNQSGTLMNISTDGKLKGHAIKFNGTGRIVEISSQ